MSDFFTAVSSTFNMKKIAKATNPILVDMPNYEYLLLTERPLQDKDLANAVRFLEYTLKAPYRLVSVLPYHEESDDIKQVVNTYENDSIDLSLYIKPNTKVITFGRALYAITKSDSLDVQSFHDFIFNKTYFYCKEYDCVVYPCHSFDVMIGQKTYERLFTIKQFEYLKQEPVLNKKRVNGVVINSTEEFLELLESHKDSKEISIDTETSSLDFVTNTIKCLQLAFNENTGYYIEWGFVDKQAFSEFVKDKFQIYANGKFDIKVLVKKGISRDSLKIDFDVNSSGHILNEMRSNSLKTNGWLYTAHGGYENELKKWLKKHKIKDYSKIPRPILEKYSWMDAVITFQVFKAHNKQISLIDEKVPMSNGWSLRRYYEEIMIPATNMFIDIEYEGLPVDEKVLQEASEEIDAKLNQIKKEFYEYVGKKESELSITSTKELGKFFMERGLPSLGPDYISKEKYYLTNDECLEAWSKLGFKEAQLLSNFRKLDIIQKTFVGRKSEKSGIWQYIVEGRIHPTFWCMLADSGRGRSSDPNLQNIPVHGDYAVIARRPYRPPTTTSNFMSSDFSGLQLRIAGMLSNDKNMREAFINLGGDLHSKTAVGALLSGKVTLEEFLRRKKDPEWKDWVKQWRLKAKGCFVAGTPIHTTKGLLNIEELVPEVSPYEHVPYFGTTKILVDDQEHVIRTTYFAYTESLIEITMENGDKLVVTPEHSMIRYENHLPIRIEAEAVQVGDLFKSGAVYQAVKKVKLIKLNYPKKVYCFSTDQHEVYVQSKRRAYLTGQCNFGLLFGKVAVSVMVGDIMPNWTEKECKDFIKDNKLKVLDLDGEKNVYYTVADFVRRKFFEEYEGLQRWHEETRAFAQKNGYVRSIHGVIRRLPELLCHDDQNRKRTANLLNIALNSPVQAVESVIVMRAMLCYTKRIKELGLKSRFFAYVHDAVEKFVPDEELTVSKEIFIEEATRDYPEYNGIPLEVEGNVADIRQGEVWDFGHDW